MTEQKRHQSQPRNIESLQPEESEQFYAVPGWRIWRYSVASFRERGFREALDEAGRKPFAIECHDGDRG